MGGSSDLPTIDLSPLQSGDDRATASSIHEACLATGFFVAVGHGLGRELDDLFAAGRNFFAEPQAVKERVPRVERHGFVPCDRWAIDRKRQLGNTEYLEVGLHDEGLLDEFADLREAIARYQRAAMPVALRLLAAMATSLGAVDDALTRHFASPQSRLRLLHYPPPPANAKDTIAEPTPPHTDYGAITLLGTDGVPGLEVEARGGWLPVDAPAGSLVVNLGDMLARWTNDLYQSTRHRVVAPDQDRYSIPFFVNPDPTTIVDCLAPCISEERPRRYEPVTASEFLAMRIDGRDEAPLARHHTTQQGVTDR